MPSRPRRQPWPEDQLYYYAAFKKRLEFIASLSESAIIEGTQQYNQPHLQMAIRLINMMADKLRLDLAAYASVRRPGKKEPGQKGGYWINEVIRLLNDFMPDLLELTGDETKSLISSKMWLQLETNMEICLDSANQILGKLLAGPQPGKLPQINESLFRYAESFLFGRPGALPTPAENKIKNLRQKVKFTIKRKRRTRVRHGGNGKSARVNGKGG